MTRLTLPGALLLALTIAGDLSAQATSPRSGSGSRPSASSGRTTGAAARPARKPGQLLSRSGARDSARPAIALIGPAPTISLAFLGGSAADPAADSGTAAAPADARTTLRDSIVALARAQLGVRYVFGGTTPQRGFDCSGLIRYIAQALRLDVPRTADEQSRSGLAVARDASQLRPGDLLTFGTRSRVTHIGIYVGDGKFIHASTAAGRIVESRLDRPPARGIKPWLGVRRLIADAGS